ncbi:hypothetical protein L1987_24980 [Smallanthus sonchifolius]|uniref:Uncharacterized protein n=1 Tax=Smallanthus sonchifolius TaxID=185202 RepID=A0ACB9IM47_9ASTR|nr:hypothetical protein L1987_24980 [Smallanthus sonchifolius]
MYSNDMGMVAPHPTAPFDSPLMRDGGVATLYHIIVIFAAPRTTQPNGKGQALGGYKRCHWIGTTEAQAPSSRLHTPVKHTDGKWWWQERMRRVREGGYLGSISGE